MKQELEIHLQSESKSYRPSPIPLRLWLPLVLLTFTALVLGYFYYSALERGKHEVVSELMREQALMAVRLKADIENSFKEGAASKIQSGFSEFSAQPEMVVALYASTKGDIVFSSQYALIGVSATVVREFAQYGGLDSSRTWLSQDQDQIISVYPVYAPGQDDPLIQSRAGTLLLVSDPSLPLAHKKADISSWMFKTGLLAISLAMLVWLMLYLAVSRRIERLLQNIDHIGRIDSIGQMLPAVTGRDEIGRLGTAFAEMVQRLECTSSQLVKLSQAVEQSAASVVITDRHGEIEYVNAAFTHTTGYLPEEVIGKRTNMFNSGKNARSVFDDLWATINSGEIWRGEIRNSRKNGELFWHEVIVSPVRNAEGEITHFVSIQEDVTARKESEERLQLFQRAVNHVNEGVGITNPEWQFVFVNPAFSAITGYSSDEVIGKTPLMLQSGLVSNALLREIRKSIKQTGRWQGEIVDRNKNGESYVAWVSLSAMRDARDFVTHYVTVFSDITERRQTEEQMVHMARHDFLTGLPNRMHLQDRLEQAIAQAEREHHRVAVFFMDLDRFKTINDTLGHIVGDRLLKEVAARISKVFRVTDTVCRQGGDEFVVVLPEMGSADDVPSIAIKLLKTVAGMYCIDGQDVEVTTSIGISMYPEDGRDGDTLLKHADTAMYYAKENGRNNYQFYTGKMTARALERSTIEVRLRRALERNEFLLHYQPQYDRVTHAIIGAEALLRWNDPERGMVPPDQFISIAEESGAIVEIGEWVLREACRQNAEWRQMGLPPITIAVNLSAAQFRQKNLGETIMVALLESGMEPSGLELEITETAIIRDGEPAIMLLHTLRELGVKLALDDFGTGYSSLGYLKLLPIDKLKIDRSFVRDMDEDESDVALINTIINMARNLNITPIAEGVETVEQFNALATFGCSEIQGYYFSKPLMPDEFASFFKRFLENP